MDKKTFGIGVLTITSVLLLVACLMPIQQADAAFALKDRDYQMVTVQSQQAGDALFVVDNRTGLVAVFTYDNAGQVMRPRKVRPISDAFLR